MRKRRKERELGSWRDGGIDKQKRSTGCFEAVQSVCLLSLFDIHGELVRVEDHGGFRRYPADTQPN